LDSTGPDQFFTGPGVGLSNAIESRVAFQRDYAGSLISMTWTEGSAPARAACRVDVERRENVRFASGDVQLAGTEAVEQVLGLMRAQYEFARTGNGWDDYLERRTALVAKMGRAPDSFPATPGHPSWQFIRRLPFHYDPAPTLQQLRLPILAIFGELDNNILADKNAAAWRAALEAGGHPDFTVTILPKANHLQLEATRGTNAEMASLRRFVPAYSTTVHQWLAKRLHGLDSSAGSRSAF
jgi:pimeloyl-ACP methyl ester carboxylesterase